MVVCIDNYDSFTYNLVQMIEKAGFETRVYRNDKVTVREIESSRPAAIVISPGPGRPASAGISVAAVRHFAATVPVLGVCLGHQAIAEACGGKVSRAGSVMHGKTSMVHHDGRGVFEGIDSPFEAVRYNSLVVERERLPSCLRVSAWTESGEIMGIRHAEFRLDGVQFHPESIMTGHGRAIIDNFLKQRRH